MDPTALTATPLAALTLIAAPAILTNSSSLLANSVTLRFLRTREIIREMYGRAQRTDLGAEEAELLIDEVHRVEIQVRHLLRSLYAVYFALGSFASATLVTLIDVGLAAIVRGNLSLVLAWLSLLLGVCGVAGLITSSVHLIQATKMSMGNILAEAERIRKIGAGVVAAAERQRQTSVLDDADESAG